jgi:hypothetical protein
MKTYNLQLTLDQIKVIGVALGEIPTKLGMPVTLEINRQIQQQEAEERKSAEVLTHDANPYSKPPNGHAEAHIN